MKINPLESEIQGKILRDLRSYGKYCVCFKIEKASENGIPDIFFSMRICGPVLVETKRPTGDASTIQNNQTSKLIMCGTKVFFCYSWKQWVEIKTILGINMQNVCR